MSAANGSAADGLRAALDEADAKVSAIHDLRSHVGPEHRQAFDDAVWAVHDILRGKARAALAEHQASPAGLDVERLAEALMAVVATQGWIDLGGMESVFMPQRFTETAQSIAAEYARLASLPADPGEEA